MNIGSTHQSQPSAAWPGLTNDLNATGPGWIRTDPLSPNLAVYPLAMRGTLLDGLSVPCDRRITIS